MESEAAVFQHQFFPDPLQQNPLSAAAGADHRRNSSGSEWDPKTWKWDSLLFLAQPSPPPGCSYQQQVQHQQPQPHQFQQFQPQIQGGGGGCKRGLGLDEGACKPGDSPPTSKFGESGDDEDAEGLTLKLGGNSYSNAEVVNGNKRQRSSSPPGSQQAGSQQPQYPMCQVDDCKADLSSAKDYHRRHKVCEMHSKAAKAQVGRLMQRFCQQCSRFHPLQEFDEGKRSCRRRLAGHNRRRRKTQPETAAAQAYLFADEDLAVKNAGLLRLLQLLSQIQAANNLEKASALQERDLALEYLKRATSVSSALGDLSSPKVEGKPFNLDILKSNGLVPQDALAAAPLLEAVSILLQGSVKGVPVVQPSKDVSPQQQQQQQLMSQALYNGNGHLAEHLQAFSRQQPAENHRRTAAAEDCSVVEVVRNGTQAAPNFRGLFPLHSAAGSEALGNSASKPVDVERAFMGRPGSTERPTRSTVVPVPAPPQSVHSQQSSESHSGSDQSPESSYADLQERTGRISFKLFDRNPGDFPQVLRSQIVEWLSHVPSDMESYIRPGCVVLAVFLSMPGPVWKNLCRDLGGSLTRLLKASTSEFWHKGMVQVQVNDELAYIVDGKIVEPELKHRSSSLMLSITPRAMVAGQKTNFVLEGITGDDTRIFSAFEDEFEVLPWDAQRDETTLSFTHGPLDTVGRCFVEVETSAGTGFVPLIVADAAVCKELNGLEDEAGNAWDRFEEWFTNAEGEAVELMELIEMAVDHEADRFLQELGWMLQRKRWKLKESQYYDVVQRYCQIESGTLKRLLVFALERNWCAVSRLLLDTVFILKDGNKAEAMALLENVHLLHRAVARNKPEMVDLLLGYKPVTDGNTTSTTVVFSPDSRGFAGMTPLHVAACIKDGEAVITALTSSQDGLRAWNTVQDNAGQTPFDNAIQCGNLAYIQMVWNRMAAGNFRPSPSVIVDVLPSTADKEPSALELALWSASTAPKKHQQQQQSCSLEVAARRRQMAGIRGPMYKPFMLSMVAIAAVCVCVCLLLKGPPQVRFVLCPFTWESVQFGPR